MKQFNFARSNPALLLFVTLSGAFFLGSCQATRLGPYSNADIQNNVYFSFFKLQKDKKLLGKMSSSSYNLMRSTFPEFLSDLNRSLKGKSLLEELPQGLIHGDFHVLQMAWRNGEAVLDDWDTAAEGPLWVDLVRIESAAIILAKEQGLRAFPVGPCMSAYRESFVNRKKLTSAKALRPGPEDEELQQDFSQHPVWKSADKNGAIPIPLETALNTWIQQNPNLPIKTFHPKRRWVAGVGSLTKEKILILDSKNQLWEMKEVDHQPLEKLGAQKTSSQGCARYDKLQKNLSGLSYSSPVKGCWEWENRSFTLLRWDSRYWSPEDKNFQRTEQLLSHVQWMCSELARFHLQSLNETDQRHWALALQTNQTLKLRIQALADSTSKNIEDAFRMILLEKTPQ